MGADVSAWAEVATAKVKPATAINLISILLPFNVVFCYKLGVPDTVLPLN
jgi:hypothetical protein